DHYEMSGPGLGAALGGGSLLVDFSGNDRYAALQFAQGAAAFGMGMLIDVEGDDEYVLGAWGQGLGLAEGVGLLWDRAGNDRYAASGVPDPHGRGSILSGAQGAAFGFRTALGGGVGILREERGDDRYEAHMFAQGSGYYYGAGLLWDEEGNDRYSAVRYAQGNGAHQALGVLREESGADSYTLSYGVGQGMGLDLAVGVLVDAAGDDRYDGGVLAQGTATANGLGLLHDAGGTDALRATGRFAWGEAQPLRGLPSVGLLLVANAVFERTESTAAESAKPRACGEPDTAVNREDFDALLAAGNALRCRLERGERWSEAEALLARDPADPLAAWIAPALPAAPAELREKLREILWHHPRCSVKALSLSGSNLEEALRSDCWMLQAAALRAGAQPGPEVRLPGFLRSRRAY
ncbi:MAG TPA: hypothetical protein VFC18_06255, partial [Burkholderiales bacterium]|nr:hypothetical protein [Burkholderiales bacterium]